MQAIIEGSVPGFTDFCRKVAAEGAVLLKNEVEMLPLRANDRVAVFGRMQVDWYRSGTGSGGSVNVEYKSNLLDGLRSKPQIILDESLASTYENWVEQHPYDNGGTGWALEPWFQQEMPLTDELVASAASHSNKALVVIGRTAGEDKDNSVAKGSYLLTDDEMLMLSQVCQHFEQVAVLLNTSNFIDLSWLQQPGLAEKIHSVVYLWQGGMEGGNAAADVLCGDVTPSGKLTDTIAFSIEDYPSTQNYGNTHQNLYQEDIYVGYRYIETFCPDKVQFEFGFGLSYTQFDITFLSGDLSAQDEFVFEVEVRNVGECYSGQEVVQLYYQAPQGALGKPLRQLGAFAKTKLLAPGEAQRLTLRLPLSAMASYDDSGATGHKSAYVLEAGSYSFHIGNSVKATQQVAIANNATWRLENTVVVEQLQEALAPVQAFTRIKPIANLKQGYNLGHEPVPQRSVDLAQRIETAQPTALKQTGDAGVKLRDVHDGKAKMTEFIAQLNDAQLAILTRGEGMSSPWVTPGTASAFGGISRELFDYGIPIACTADGPSGIRMDGGGTATQMPIGTLLAATWNTELVQELYEFESQELLNYQIDVLLGPGLNIRRSPLNGRNFEYFSEDPLVTGAFTVACVNGIMKHGANATLKHFACNNQEKDRTLIDAVVSERAVREIYLKGFEMAVKQAGANSIMTAYNPINGHWTASNYDLNTTILRKEWGFKGIVMTDWWAKMNHVSEAGEADKRYSNHMLRSQNDLYMVVDNFGAQLNSSNDNTLASLQDGSLNRAELQRSATNICEFLMKTPAFFRKQEFKEQVESFEPAPDCTAEDLVNISAADKLPIIAGGDTWFTVSEAGEYRVNTETMSTASNEAQMESCLLLNGKRMALIQTHGSGGEWIPKQLTKVKLAAGVYRLHFEHIHAGMQMEWLQFRKLD